ncbi:hypothetical protein [Paenibacillus illinoisensis]|uniref:hypothetical protein n=1 Tax=Paenibacillus illinoisensis TaxID=59845 RepID=UPI00203CE38D|nr:hypothetical protein [Paenibacillus illinoisensis]
MYKKIVLAINKQVGIPVLIAEFFYPSGEVQVHMPDGQKPSRATHIMKKDKLLSIMM